MSMLALRTPTLHILKYVQCKRMMPSARDFLSQNLAVSIYDGVSTIQSIEASAVFRTSNAIVLTAGDGSACRNIWRCGE